MKVKSVRVMGDQWIINHLAGIKGWTFAAGCWWSNIQTPQEKMSAPGTWNPLENISDALACAYALEMNFVIGRCRGGQHSAFFFNSVWALGKPVNAVPENGDPNLYGWSVHEELPRAICLAIARATR